jgi:hypothetical protein
MLQKVLMTGGAALLTLSALGATAFAQEQSRAPVPTTPTSTTATTLSVGGVAGTTTTQPATSVQRSTEDGVANTGPHDYIAWVSLAGVVSVALGVSMRGRRADGNHWRE